MAKYVIQFHKSKKEHYDFRLQIGNVAKSWAIPKQPPLKPGIKRLAVLVDDHTIEYMDFQGEIPEGHYGAGKVEIWDKGTFNLVDGDMNKGKLIVDIKGKKLKGEYVLLKFKDQDKNWLLFKKEKDKA